MSMALASYDIDGVIYQGPRVPGFRPRPDDVVITGRSFEEEPETLRMLKDKGIGNKVYFAPARYEDKTREGSGLHKAHTLLKLRDSGLDIAVHYEDDEVQVAVIRKYCPWIEVVHVVSDLVEKENVRHEWP